MGNLPESWAEINLGEICSIKTGKKDANAAVDGGKYPFFTCAAEPLRIDTYLFDDECIILPGNGANVGLVLYYKGKLDAYQRTYIVHNCKIDTKYLYFYLKCYWAIYNEDRQYGSATNYIRLNNLTDFPLSIAPLPEQKRIVKKLEKLLTEVETAQERLEKIPKILKRFRQSVLINSFKYIETFDLLKNHADMCLGKMLDKSKNKGIYQPYLRNLNVRWIDFDLSDLSEMKFEVHENERFNAIKGDLIICEGGEPGRCAIWTSDKTIKIQKALHRVRCKNTLNTEFLMYYILYLSSNGGLEEYFTGTTIKHLTGASLKKLNIPLLPVEEQQEIVERVKELFEKADRIEERYKKAKTYTDKLTQSILNKAFKGKLVPQDPNNEPAGVLLERVKAEKADTGKSKVGAKL